MTMLMDARLPNHFWSKVMPEPNTGCWLWLGSSTPDGYSKLKIKSATTIAHRLAYETLVGPVPRDLVLDHLCRNRWCTNPLHLEPVTRRENARRGIRGVLTTHCPAGHEYNDSNTYAYESSNGERRRCCRACNRAAKAVARGAA